MRRLKVKATTMDRLGPVARAAHLDLVRGAIAEAERRARTLPDRCELACHYRARAEALAAAVARIEAGGPLSQLLDVVPAPLSPERRQQLERAAAADRAPLDLDPDDAELNA